MVASCRRRGWLDDAACARLWADQWARAGYGWTAIQAKLQAKGLGAEAIRRADEALGLSRSDEARARQALAGCGDAGGGRSRLARRLAARGFDAELIEQVLATSLEPTDSDA